MHGSLPLLAGRSAVMSAVQCCWVEQLVKFCRELLLRSCLVCLPRGEPRTSPACPGGAMPVCKSGTQLPGAARAGPCAAPRHASPASWSSCLRAASHAARSFSFQSLSSLAHCRVAPQGEGHAVTAEQAGVRGEPHAIGIKQCSQETQIGNPAGCQRLEACAGAAGMSGPSARSTAEVCCAAAARRLNKEARRAISQQAPACVISISYSQPSSSGSAS